MLWPARFHVKHTFRCPGAGGSQGLACNVTLRHPPLISRSMQSIHLGLPHITTKMPVTAITLHLMKSIEHNIVPIILMKRLV